MTTLSQGDRGPAVLELQTLLAMTGHDPGPLDGVFGPRTRAALLARRGCTDPGVADEWALATDDDMRMLRAISPRRPVELPRILTPITAVNMRIALACGYAEAFLVETDVVPRAPIRVALAQLCVEHGCGPWRHPEHPLTQPWIEPAVGVPSYVSVWCNNIGNRQVGAEDRALDERNYAYRGPLVPWFSMSPVEGSGTSAHRATGAHYAYPNAAEGAAAYWRFLRDHCGPALAAFEAGDPARAAHKLKVGTWHYSGDEAAYTKAMVDRFRGIE